MRREQLRSTRIVAVYESSAQRGTELPYSFVLVSGIDHGFYSMILCEVKTIDNPKVGEKRNLLLIRLRINQLVSTNISYSYIMTTSIISLPLSGR